MTTIDSILEAQAYTQAGALGRPGAVLPPPEEYKPDAAEDELDKTIACFLAGSKDRAYISYVKKLTQFERSQEYVRLVTVTNNLFITPRQVLEVVERTGVSLAQLLEVLNPE